jgi:hydroxyacylglutathione hydrolase
LFRQIAGPVYFRASNSMDSNIGFIDTGDAKILIDTGTGIYHRNLDMDLQSIGSSAEEITDIILTHSHIDHIGGVLPFLELQSPKLHLHRSEAELINSGNMMLTLGNTFGVDLPPFKIHNLLEENDIITFGDVHLRVYNTPGHSIGSICLHVEDLQLLFTGDTMFPGGSFGRVDFPTGSPKDLVLSLKRISEMDFEIALPGHMNAITSNAKYHAESSYKMAKSWFRT